MSEATLLLEACDVAKRFDSVVALKAASLRVRPGEVHGLMGANGAGKSTLVKIITGVFPADGGQIAVKGVVRSFRSPAEARRAGIVSVYQDPALVPDLTIAQNMRLAGASIEAARKWLAELGVVRVDFSLLVRDLPDPTLRLIDLARALSWEPAVLLLDEITASLPADLSEQIYTMVKRWRERGNAVIFISHRMAEVSALCDRATVLRDGVTAGVTERAHGSEERIVALMLGAETARAVASAPSTRAPRQRSGDAQAALEVRGLRCSPLVNDVSFKLYPGEVLGVAALEGQGQEELFDCIAGSRRYDEGAIFAHGKEFRLRHPADAIAAGIVLIPANRLLALLPQRPIPENIALPAFGGIRNWGPIRIRAERMRVESAIGRLQIDTRAGSELRRLSGGNQQKVVIAKALLTEPDILILDEPTRGIDIGAKAEVYAIITQLARDGKAIIMVSSELLEILSLSDRILVMREGAITAELDPRQTTQEEVLKYAMPD